LYVDLVSILSLLTECSSKSARLARAACARPLGTDVGPNGFVSPSIALVGARTIWWLLAPPRESATLHLHVDASWSNWTRRGCFTNRPCRPGPAPRRGKCENGPWPFAANYWRIAQPGDLVEIRYQGDPYASRRAPEALHSGARISVSRLGCGEALTVPLRKAAGAFFLKPCWSVLPFP